MTRSRKELYAPTDPAQALYNADVRPTTQRRQHEFTDLIITALLTPRSGRAEGEFEQLGHKSSRRRNGMEREVEASTREPYVMKAGITEVSTTTRHHQRLDIAP